MKAIALEFTFHTDVIEVPDTDYEKRFDTWTTAAWGIRGFKSWSSTFTVYGAGKYWGISGGGISRSVIHYWMVYDLGNAMSNLMNSIKRQAK